MAIIVSTLSVNAIVKSGPGKSIFEDGKSASGATSTWLQGDILCFDTSTKVLRRVAATGDALTLVGIADNVVTAGKLAGPYDGLTPVDAAQVSPGFAGPKYGVIANMKLKTGDAFTMGAKCYLADTLDCQTVSVTDPGDGNYIGIFQGVAVTGASGVVGPVLVGARYPSATGTGLSF